MSTADIKKERISPEPVGFLLSRFGLIATLIILIIAAWFGQFTIAVLLGLVLAAAGVARLWSRFSLNGVTCQRQVSESHVFPGDTFELKIKISNRKLLPLPWVQVEDEVPLNFAPEVTPGERNRPGFGFLTRSTALLWYTTASWHCQLKAVKRGYYQLGPVRVSSGDIFGFYPRLDIAPVINHLVVYPRIFNFIAPEVPSVYPLGDAKSARRIFEDPTRSIGVRDYSPHDSLRRIHWKASARHQKLQSRVYEPTTTLKVALFLAADTFPSDSPQATEDYEFGISLAASIANYLVEQDSPVGLLANACLADSGEAARIPAGSSVDHLVRLLEALAKITRRIASPFDEFVQAERANLPWGTTIVFVVSQPFPYFPALITSLKDRGYRLLVIQVGDEAGKIEGVAWYNISRAAEKDGLAQVRS